MKEIDFNGDVVIITGASRGIGRETMRQFADEGAVVAGIYHSNHEAAEEAQDYVEEHTDYRPDMWSTDVREFEEVSETIDEIVDQHGRPRVLVNNAAIVRNSPLLNMDVDVWDSVIDTNLTGAFNCSKAVYKHMLLQDNGAIINLSSNAAHRAWAGQTNYAASKTGIWGFTRALSRELGHRGIRVNTVSPGYTETDLVAQFRDAREEQLERIVEEDIPLQRTADREEVANVIVFVASDLASYVNGSNIRVDGGLLS